MRIQILLENDTVDSALLAEHGLSMHIESQGRRYLFDMGPPGGAFLENARAMEVDLSRVDAAMLSHGHYDHGGGLAHFLEVNGHAPVHVREEAFHPHRSRRDDGLFKDIGVDPALKDHPRMVFVKADFPLDAGLLFFQVEGKALLPPGNESLFEEVDGALVLDAFRHEMHLLLQEKGEWVLFCGCGHQGVLNIVEAARLRIGSYPRHVVGGFHLKRPGRSAGTETLVEELGERLLATGSTYHTCHCTGDKVFRRLQEIMGSRIRYLNTGSVLTLFEEEEA